MEELPFNEKPFIYRWKIRGKNLHLHVMEAEQVEINNGMKRTTKKWSANSNRKKKRNWIWSWLFLMDLLHRFRLCLSIVASLSFCVFFCLSLSFSVFSVFLCFLRIFRFFTIFSVFTVLLSVVSVYLCQSLPFLCLFPTFSIAIYNSLSHSLYPLPLSHTFSLFLNCACSFWLCRRR